jgi:hypothetical protein
MRGAFTFAAAVAIPLIVAVTYVVQKPSLDDPLMAVTSSEVAGSIPTPEYLFEHPDALKEAEQKCHDDGASSSLYCSNVHKAESLRMADQYRRALQPKGAAK